MLNYLKVLWMKYKLVNGQAFKVIYIVTSLFIHFWTIVNYTFYSLKTLFLTAMIPFGSELYWIINNRNEKDTGSQFDLIASIFLLITGFYIMFNFSVAIKSIKYIYYYFTAWFFIYLMWSLLGLFSYSSNSIIEFQNLNYFEYYKKAVLEDSGWLITYTFLIGWWFTYLVISYFKKHSKVKF